VTYYSKNMIPLSVNPGCYVEHSVKIADYFVITRGSLLGLEYVTDGIHYMIRIRTASYLSGLHVQVRGEIFIAVK